MKRRSFIQLFGAAAGSAFILKSNGARIGRSHGAPDFEWEEAQIPQLQAAMEQGRETAHSLAQLYINRIEKLDRSGPRLNAVIELNPDALAIARELDLERHTKGPRGPLHGIPVLLKDNIDTNDRMMTTAGSLALVGALPPRDSFVAARLRKAGAVILGKTNLSEWANFRSTHSTSGWSGRGGLTRNPYVLDRNTSGSSSGSAAAVSANLCAVAVGTETDGSIISPSSYCGVVGLKPTVGLISRSGIIPISSTQDTAGPMARTVRDAAILLGALTGLDPLDEKSKASAGKYHSSYTEFLDPNGLKGMRIGVARRYFASVHPDCAKILESALAAMRSAGAILVDPADPLRRLSAGESEYEGMLFEFKHGLNKYLSSLQGNPHVRSLAQLIEFNLANAPSEMPWFGQEILIEAQEKGPITDPAYQAVLAKNRLFCERGTDSVFEQHNLDAIVGPSGGPAPTTDLVHGDRDGGGSSQPAAIAGYPSITVPAGQLHGLPFGLSFWGKAFSEPVLFKIAYAFENLVQARRTPRFIPTLKTVE